jgi:hypothetical protein
MLSAFGFAGAGLYVVSHPLGWKWPLMGLFAFALMAALRRDAWLVLLPGLLPVVDLAPWTGMIHFTESDALVLCTLAVFGLREAWRPSVAVGRGGWRFGPTQIGLVALMAASYALSTAWAPLAGLGQDPNLLVAYDSPLNGVRLAKGFVFALLLLPVLAVSFRADPQGAPARFAQGMLLGLLLVSLAALWERLAFPGLSDFASDYRTTALFWEMNVGGAQLDGWLALSLPFLFWGMLRQKSVPALMGLALIAVLAGYATFTTFSRGLYAGAAIGVACVIGLMAMRRKGESGRALSSSVLLLVLVLAAVCAGLLAGVFQTAGYRGMAAMLGLAVAVYLVGPSMPGLSWRGTLLALLLAGMGAFASVVSTALMPKGAYLVFAASTVLLGAMRLAQVRLKSLRLLVSALWACLFWMGANAVLVAVFWGGSEATAPAMLAVAGLLLPLMVIRVRPTLAWQASLPGGVMLLVGLGAIASGVVMFNTYYAAQRLKTIDEDLAGRRMHWEHGLSLSAADERWLGIGTGRFAERYFWTVPSGAFPGKHRIGTESGNRFLRLSGPRYVLGYGELYRVAQHVDPDLNAPLLLSLQARAPERGASLRIEVCRKHLLYPQGCVSKAIHVPFGADWKSFEVMLTEDGLGSAGGGCHA